MDKYAGEIESLHAWFEGWFRGTIPPGDFDRFERSLAPDFTLIDPNGTLNERATILDAVFDAHGGRDVSISAGEARALWSHGGLHCLSYVESQVLADGKSTRRRSTVVFCDDESAPSGVL